MKLEIIKDFDGTYYCNLRDVSEYVSLSQLKTALKDKHGITLNPLSSLEKIATKRKTYYYQEV